MSTLSEMPTPMKVPPPRFDWRHYKSPAVSLRSDQVAALCSFMRHRLMSEKDRLHRVAMDTRAGLYYSASSLADSITREGVTGASPDAPEARIVHINALLDVVDALSAWAQAATSRAQDAALAEMDIAPRHEGWPAKDPGIDGHGLLAAVVLMAQPWRDHPMFDPAWAPVI